jgi:prophage antirepressor-like protein
MIMRENRNIPFRDWNIRVSRNHSGHLHICAMDVCNILKVSSINSIYPLVSDSRTL